MFESKLNIKYQHLKSVFGTKLPSEFMSACVKFTGVILSRKLVFHDGIYDFRYTNKL